jgi:hypothetical protein
MGQLVPGRMEILPVEIAPGFISDKTQYAAGGRWWDGDGVRFRKGYPEKIGGWTRLLAPTWLGVCRNMFAWSDLTTKKRIALGTSVRALAYDDLDRTLIDITPNESTTTLGLNPLAATSSSPIITVTHVSHGMTTGRYVRLSGATTFAGLTVGNLSGEFLITVLTVNTYTITVGANASSTASGGGSSVVASYILRAFDTLSGWGAGAYGEAGWGTGVSLSLATAEPAMWSFDNWGEDLLLNARGLGIYYYDVTTPSVPAVNISALPGASDTPAAATQVMVDAELRFALALGASPIGSPVRDPMFVRWPDRGSITNWSVGPTSTAGGFRLASGSRIVRGIKTRREIMVFTDTTLYSLQAVGGTSIFKPTVASQEASIVGPNAATVDQGDTIYWMGRGNFYKYDGRVTTLDCDITDRVFDDINYGAGSNIICGHNPQFDEIWWMYPSSGSTENNRYATFNYAEQVWTNGAVLKRSAWLSSTLFDNPLTAGERGVYLQENGYDDNDTGSAVPIASHIYSAPTEVDDGNYVLRVNRILPDLDFGRTSPAVTPIMTYSITSSDWPGSTSTQNQARSAVAGMKTSEMRPFTDKLDLQVRGVKFGIRVDNAQLGVFWRMGRQRVRVKIDGKR